MKRILLIAFLGLATFRVDARVNALMDELFYPEELLDDKAEAVETGQAACQLEKDACNHKKILIDYLDSLEVDHIDPDIKEKITQLKIKIEAEDQGRFGWLWESTYIRYAISISVIYAIAYYYGYAPSLGEVFSIFSSLFNIACSQYNLWLANPSSLKESLRSEGKERFLEGKPAFSETVAELPAAFIRQDVVGFVEAVEASAEAVADASLDSVLDKEKDWGPFEDSLPQARYNTAVVGAATYVFKKLMNFYWWSRPGYRRLMR